jgi:hypothetical protein
MTMQRRKPQPISPYSKPRISKPKNREEQEISYPLIREYKFGLFHFYFGEGFSFKTGTNSHTSVIDKYGALACSLVLTDAPAAVTSRSSYHI